MKNTLLVLLSLIMIVFSTSAFAKKVEESPVMRDGLFYEPFSTNIANGQYEIYHKNGQMNATMTFKDGNMEGLWVVYYENGQLKYGTTYKDGKLNGHFESYHGNGQLGYRTTYKDGKLNGPFEGYHKNGQLKEKSSYKDGKANGPYERYYENGKINKERQYGLFESSIYPGTLSSKCFYVSGKKSHCN